MMREKISLGVWLLLAGSLVQTAEPWLVPTPRASVMPTSATNRPFLAATRSQQPVDLAARGYAETELLVRGYANIRDWATDSSEPAIRHANLPYATRALVRRPLDATRFSGRVIVELLDPGGQYDSAPLWGFSYEHFLRRGDVWVGLTINPVAIATLQKFDPVRYGALGFAFRQPEGCADPKDAEGGLAWDAIAQVGALLRSSSKENPLLDLNPQRLIAAGYGEAGGFVTTFANALHGRLRRGDGAPIFDGYLNAAGSMTAIPIHQCATPLPEGDPRRVAMPRDVPFVTVMTESESNRAAARQRDDSDTPGDVFRLYEIAAAAHRGPFAAGTPTPTDLTIAGFDLPAEGLCREPRSDLPLGLAFNAIWQQFDELLVQQLPMVSIPRIETDASLAPQVDATGNAQGGWRLPQIELPVARYAGRSTPADGSDRARRVCALTGSMQRFDAARLKALYRDRNEYLRRFNAAVEQAVFERRLVREDADALKLSAARVTPAF